jgi:hypothetical protein
MMISQRLPWMCSTDLAPNPNGGGFSSNCSTAAAGTFNLSAASAVGNLSAFTTLTTRLLDIHTYAGTMQSMGLVDGPLHSAKVTPNNSGIDYHV